MKDFQTIQGWLFEEEAELLKRFAQEQQEQSDCDLLEIGPWRGRSTLTIASVLTGDHRLWTVDHFRGSPEHQKGGRFYKPTKYSRREGLWVYPELVENIVRCGMQDKVIILPLASKLAAQAVQEKFCFIFIDGLHTYEGVSSDWDLWFPHLELGGICLFHDCRHSPIKQLIDELRLWKTLEIVGEARTTLAFRKLR